MNQTPRMLNRSILLITGLCACALGAGILTASISQLVLQRWQEVGAGAIQWVTELLDQTATAAGISWAWFLLLAVMAVVLVLCVVVVARQGGGRTTTLMRCGQQEATPNPLAAEARPIRAGSVVVDTGVAQSLLTEAMMRDPAVLSVQITGHHMRRHTALRVAIVLRKGASPALIARRAEEIVGQWDHALGAQVPVVIDIAGGIRARLRSEARVT